MEVSPHRLMALETECAQEVAEQEVQEPEERLAHQLEALEAVGSLEHQLAQDEHLLEAHLGALVHPSPPQHEKLVHQPPREVEWG